MKAEGRTSARVSMQLSVQATMTAALMMWLAGLILSLVSHAAPVEDFVTYLPGYGPPKTPNYSGFLNGENGTKLHYWLAQSSNGNSDAMPVILWLNGGPGSSSILGMLQEHGPLLINRTGGLFENPYTWTSLANVVVLESPGGVGYSYCSNMTQGGSCYNTDKSTARNNRLAMQDFFRKFPEYKANDFYITGESYAGVYVPTLAKEILDQAPEIRLKGLAVGDPCTDNDSQRDSMDMLWYGHKYGFVPDADFDFLWNVCGTRHPSALKSGHWSKKTLQSKLRYNGKSRSAECLAAHRRFVMITSKAFSQDWPLAFVNDVSLYGYAELVSSTQPGSLNYMTAAWMMRQDVREALHVTAAPQRTWPGPAGSAWTYTSDYAACNANAAQNAPSMIDFYRYIAPRVSRTIVYNGDTDPCVSYEGTRTAIERVNFQSLPNQSYRPWFFNATGVSAALLQEKAVLYGPSLVTADLGPQLGGHIVDYEHNLSFMTIHGSGHLVPENRPRAAMHMITKLLSGRPFSPPLPDHLDELSEAVFDQQYDAWVRAAQYHPYL